MKLWNDKKKTRSNAQKVISEILSSWNGDGFPISAKLLYQKNWLSMNSEKCRLSEENITTILSNMARSGKKVLEDFEELYEEVIIPQTRIYSSLDWQFFVPIYIKPGKNLAFPLKLKFYGKHVSIEKWETIINSIGANKIETVLSSAERKIAKDKINYVISISGSGATADQSWKSVQASLECYIGALESSSPVYYLANTYDWINSRGKYPLSSWFIAIPSEGQAEWIPFLTEQSVDKNDVVPESPPCLEKGDWEKFKLLAKKFSEPPHDKSSLSLIASCFRLYAQATQERLPHRHLMAYWNIAETLALPCRNNGNTGIVCKRLSWLVPEVHGDTFVVEGVLEKLAEKRNNIVHKGFYEDISSAGINSLKFTCDVIINFFLENLDDFKTENDIEHFYKHHASNRRDLCSIKRGIKAVIRHRGKR